MKSIKKAVAIIVTAVMTMLVLAACGGTAKNSLLGTWTAESAEYNGSTFTVSELEAMGDYSISNIYIVIKEGGAAYVSEGGSGTQVEWYEISGGIKIGVQECKVVDGKIIIENNGAKIILAKQSDSQEITTAEATTTETTETTKETTTASETKAEPSSESAAESEATTAKKTEEDSKDLDPKLVSILEDIEKHIKEAADASRNGADQLLAGIGDSYDNYKSNVEAINDYYASNISAANELYTYLETTSVEFFKAVADLKMDYRGWNNALDEFYDVWNGGMDDYYDAWNGKFDEMYDRFNEIIDSNSDNVDYSEYSDTWSDMYNAYSDSWSDMYNIYSDSWSLVYNNYSDVWSGFNKDNFDVDAILNDKK